MHPSYEYPERPFSPIGAQPEGGWGMDMRRHFPADEFPEGEHLKNKSLNKRVMMPSKEAEEAPKINPSC
jgi:hypothetical protein